MLNMPFHTDAFGASELTRWASQASSIRSATAAVAIHTNTQPNIARALAVTALLVAIAGCTAPAPWPASLSSVGRNAVSGNSCPRIEGTYVNVADANNSCSSIDTKACNSLTFYFFSAHVPEAAGVSNFPTLSDDWPTGTHVQIEQPAEDVLRIVSLDGSNAGRGRVLATKNLDRKSGDFECEGNTIRLKPRVQHDAQLWMGRRTNTEYLVVSSDQDSLAVQSTRHYETYILWFVGGTMREEQIGHRWQRVK